MNKHETICAVVVTYNRKHLLLECLEAIRKQTRPVQAIYIIDNHSIDGTPELLLEKGYINQLPPPVLTEPWEIELSISNQTNSEPIEIHYIRMHENTGGAGGFHEGLKRAYEKGYDWFWLMDDDVEP
ncbi:MAG: glycosyltransferase, partial [bacterium]